MGWGMGGLRYHPYREAERLGLRIISRELPGAMWGCLHIPSRTIIVDRWLCQTERRCTVAHEIVHWERRDDCHQDARIEREVHTVAAHRLIPFEDVLRVAPWTASVREMAEEWWVDDETAEVRIQSMLAWEREALADWHSETA